MINGDQHGKVGLGEACGLDDDVLVHRRPNLATAPTMTEATRTPIMPTPAMPHRVEVVTVTRKFVDADLHRARRRGYRRDVVPGNVALVGRRNQRLNFLVVVRRDAVRSILEIET